MAGLRELGEADLGAVQALIERCADYYVLTTGAGPKPGSARGVWDALPPEMSRSVKLTLGLNDGGRLVAIADVVRGWPRPQTWPIGLLLLDPAVRGRGSGARIVAAVDALAAAAGAQTLRVAVVDANAPALAFWQRVGFTEVAATQPGAIALERAVAS